MKKKIEVHPNTPAALKRDLRKCNWNMRALARLRDVNVYWVNRLVRFGEEPKNATTRLKLSLSKHPRKPRQERLSSVPVSEHVRWWRKLAKEERDQIIFALYARTGE